MLTAEPLYPVEHEDAGLSQLQQHPKSAHTLSGKTTIISLARMTNHRCRFHPYQFLWSSFCLTQQIMKRLIKRYVLKAQVDKENDEVNEGEVWVTLRFLCIKLLKTINRNVCHKTNQSDIKKGWFYAVPACMFVGP